MPNNRDDLKKQDGYTLHANATPFHVRLEYLKILVSEVAGAGEAPRTNPPWAPGDDEVS